MLPQELSRIIPALPSVPVQLLWASSFDTDGSIEHLKQNAWVLGEYQYENVDEARRVLANKIIIPAAAKTTELAE
jgi:hypothetical protein